MKLPPDTPAIMSTSSMAGCVSPRTVMGVRRNSSNTPYDSAAARVPPPEKARSTSAPGSFRELMDRSTSRSTRYPLLRSTRVIGGLTTGMAVHPARPNAANPNSNLHAREAKVSTELPGFDGE